MLIFLKESILLYSAYSVTIKVLHNYKSHIYVLVKSTFECNHRSEARSPNKAEIKCVNIFFCKNLFASLYFHEVFPF